MKKLKKQQIIQTLLMTAICSGTWYQFSINNVLAASTPIVINNNSFELLNEKEQAVDWSNDGDVSAVSIQKDAYEGQNALIHKKAEAYEATTSQKLTNLEEGYYTLTAWIKSSGGQKNAYIFAKDFGASIAKASIPNKDGWTLVTLRGIHVTNGQCTVGLYSNANAGNWVKLDNISLVKDDNPYTLLKGGDISELTFVEDNGAKFYDQNGAQKDCLQILRENGLNFVRLRLYNEPGKGRGDGNYYCPEGYLDEQNILSLARRAKDKDFTIQLSFHYSDYWTNGASQFIPAKWQEKIKGLDEQQAVNVLEQCVYDYTKQVLQNMNAQGTTPEYISLGNEIQSGMLFPYGKATEDNWKNLARFFNAGAKAVREVCPKSKIILHLDGAGDLWKYDNFFNHCQQLNVDYDIIGTSYYPFFTQKNATEIGDFCKIESEKFGKPIVFMETGFAWNTTLPNGQPGQLGHNGPYQMTKQAHKEFMQDLFNEMKNVSDGRVIGDLYWDPIMIQLPNVGWAIKEKDDKYDVNVVSNTTLFDFDGKVLPVFDAYKDNTEGEIDSIISGVVTGKNGRVLSNVGVVLVANGKTYTTITDKYGGYMFNNVPEGENYQIRFANNGYNTAQIILKSVEKGQVVYPEQVKLEGAALAGYIYDDYGNAVKDVDVTVKANNETYTTKTNTQGYYELKDLPANTDSVVEISHKGYITKTINQRSIAIGQTDTKNLYITKNSGIVTGWVKNEKNGPVADVLIEVKDSNGNIFNGLTDDQGKYTIADVTANNECIVTASKVGFVSKSFDHSIIVANRETTNDVNFVLAKNVFAIKGNVYDENNIPLANAKVWAVSEDGEQAYSTNTDENGAYSIYKILAGKKYNLSAYYGEKPSANLDQVSAKVGTTIDNQNLYIPINIAINNADFEQWGIDKYDIVGWNVTGTPNSVVVQGTGHTGKINLAAWLDKAYEADINQILTNLSAGKYTLTAYIMNSSNQSDTYMYIKDVMGNRTRCNLPLSPSGWSKVNITVDLPEGDTVIGFATVANGGDWIAVDDVSLVKHNN